MELLLIIHVKLELHLIFHVKFDISVVIISLDDGSSRAGSHNLPARFPDFSLVVFFFTLYG